jgi:putative peptidoglycan lipid II flippase
VLATVAVNVITCLGLLLALRQRLGGLPLLAWARDTALLLGASLLAGLVAWALASFVAWPADFFGRLWQTAISGAAGLLLYTAVAGALRVPEAQQVIGQVTAKLPRRGRG